MPTPIEQLKQLQLVDAQLFALRRQAQEKPRELEESRQKLAAQEARLKDADARVKLIQLAQKEKEGELASREANVRKLQGQLFQLKTNKEYSTMQHEIATLKADNSLIEEAILKYFDEIESANSGKHEEQKQTAALQEAFKVEEKRVQEELLGITQRISQLEAERKQLTPGVPIPALEIYERILVSRNGMALAPLAKESCGGCHRRLPPQVWNEVVINTKLVTCENCNRILFAPDGGSSPV